MKCPYCLTVSASTRDPGHPAFCSVCGSPLREDGKPHPEAAALITKGRAEERAEIVAYMRREAVQFMASGVGMSVLPGKQGEVAKTLFDVMGAAVEGLAGFFEDGGLLR